MKLTLSQIQTLQQDPEYKMLPVSISLEKSHSNWVDMAENLTEEGFKQVLWCVLQHMAVMFDTYGEAIKEAKLVHNERYEHYIPYINDRSCMSVWHVLKKEELKLGNVAHAVCQQADDYAAMTAFISECEHVNHHLHKELTLIDAYLSEPITSAQETREKAKEIAPEVQAWVKTKLLSQHVNQRDSAKAANPKI